jgi:hypothetical protein
MADQKSLRVIGFGFTAVTAAVTLVAALVVADASRSDAERPAAVAAAAAR